MITLEDLATEELGCCCVYRFLKEVKHISGKKVAEALGLSTTCIYKWRHRFALRELEPCANCRVPQRLVELKRTSSGRPYFVRSGGS